MDLYTHRIVFLSLTGKSKEVHLNEIQQINIMLRYPFMGRKYFGYVEIIYKDTFPERKVEHYYYSFIRISSLETLAGKIEEMKILCNVYNDDDE